MLKYTSAQPPKVHQRKSCRKLSLHWNQYSHKWTHYFTDDIYLTVIFIGLVHSISSNSNEQKKKRTWFVWVFTSFWMLDAQRNKKWNWFISIVFNGSTHMFQAFILMDVWSGCVCVCVFCLFLFETPFFKLILSIPFRKMSLELFMVCSWLFRNRFMFDVFDNPPVIRVQFTKSLKLWRQRVYIYQILPYK